MIYLGVSVNRMLGGRSFRWFGFFFIVPLLFYLILILFDSVLGRTDQ